VALVDIESMLACPLSRISLLDVELEAHLSRNSMYTPHVAADETQAWVHWEGPKGYKLQLAGREGR
jgi:hypothetical protein